MLKSTISRFVLAAAGMILAACTDTAETRQTVSPESAATVAQTDAQTGVAPHQGHGGMQMNLGPKDETFDLRFIDAMTLHHQGAIEMAETALEQSDRPEIRQLAQAIIEAQQQEIQQMQGWRQSWYPDADDQPVMYHADMGHMMPMAAEMRASMMMNPDLGAADESFDLRFINAMIPHHQGAVQMAQAALTGKPTHPEVQALAQGIIDSQQQEIEQMQQWRQAWYAQ
jgi:uncharacterized protein (DUF305 family)